MIYLCYCALKGIVQEVFLEWGMHLRTVSVAHKKKQKKKQRVTEEQKPELNFGFMKMWTAKEDW